jgi:hypothetical protein
MLLETELNRAVNNKQRTAFNNLTLSQAKSNLDLSDRVVSQLEALLENDETLISNVVDESTSKAIA